MREPTIAQCEQEIVALRDMLRMERSANELLRKLLPLATEMAEWHIGDGDECGEIARQAWDLIEAHKGQSPSKSTEKQS